MLNIIRIFMYLTVLNSCDTKENNNIELSPVIFQNIQEAYAYLNANIKTNGIDYSTVFADLHSEFKNSIYSGLMGYNYHGGVVLADLDKDGIYELYLNASTGSGIIHMFIHGYNPSNKKYYILSKRMEFDYTLFIHRNDLFVYANQDWYWKSQTKDIGNIKIFKPALLNNELILENINDNLYNEIMNEIESDLFYFPYKIK